MKEVLLLSFLILSFLPSCKMRRGTDEASTFSLAPQISRVDFSVLKAQVLEPFCLKCHQDYQTELGLSPYVQAGDPANSKLFQIVAQGLMPKGGSKLQSGYIHIIEQYIIQAPAVPPGVPEHPSPPLVAPTFRSIKENLLRRSCLQCHFTGNSRHRLELEDFAQVKGSAKQIFERLDPIDPEDLMPPMNAKTVPRPTQQAIDAFKEWMMRDFPE